MLTKLVSPTSGLRVSGWYNADALNITNTSLNLFTRDMFEVSGNVEVPYPTVSSETYNGWDFPVHTHFYGNKPSMSPQLVQHADRYSRLAEIVSHTRSLFSDWKFRSQRNLDPGEKPVSHLSLRGWVEESSPDNWNAPTGYFSIGNVSTPSQFSVRNASYNGTQYVKPEFETKSCSWGALFTNHLERLTNMRTLVYLDAYNTYPTSLGFKFFLIPDMKFVLTSTGWIAIAVRYWCTNANKHSITLDYHEYRCTPTSLDVGIDDVTDVHLLSNIKRKWGFIYLLSSASGPGYPIYQGSSYQSQFQAAKLEQREDAWGTAFRTNESSSWHFLTHHPQLGGTEDLVGLVSGSYTVKDHSYLSFRNMVSEVVQDCYPLVIYSTDDAVETMSGAMDVNGLEYLFELKSYLGLSSVASLMKKAYATISQARSGSLFLRAIDILTDANLAYSFMVRPSISDAKAVSSAARSFKHALLDGTALKGGTYYGSYTVDLPEDLRREFNGTSVTVRSKIRGRLDPESLWSYLAPVDSLGLLPSLSRTWNVLPWSFVVDWIFSIDKLLTLADSGIVFQLVDITSSTHSVLVEYEVEDDECSSRGITKIPGPSGDTCFQYRYYERFPLVGLPIPAPSRIIASSITSDTLRWGVAGSLLYQKVG